MIRNFSASSPLRYVNYHILLQVLHIATRVVDPYSFFTDPDPDPELDVGGQYGSGSKSGSGSNTDPGL
jgi:hypothetical protein